MTSLRPATLRQLARTVLERRGARAGGEMAASAAQRAYDDLVDVCSPLIGQVGVDALTARALHLAQREYPWLRDPEEPGPPDEPFVPISARLARQDPAVATDGAAALLALLLGLLVTFIGDPLTTSLIRKAWPEAFSAAHTEEK